MSAPAASSTQGTHSRAYTPPTGHSANDLPVSRLTRARRVRARRASILFDQVVFGGVLAFVGMVFAALIGAACWGGC